MAYTDSSEFAKKFCAKSPFKHNSDGDDKHAKQHQEALERKMKKEKKKIIKDNIDKYNIPKIT